MERIIIHWTAGSYTPSSLDKEHYHFLIDGDGFVHNGKYPVEANRSTSDADGYAAHTRFMNTGSIGVSLCAMAGATPTNYGQYPITDAQWDTLFVLLANLCEKYNIPVRSDTVLSHAEVEPTLGVKQRGKWDISVFPYTYELGSPIAVGETIREYVNMEKARVKDSSSSAMNNRVSPPSQVDKLNCVECGKIMMMVPYSSAIEEKEERCRKVLLKVLSVYFSDDSLLEETREHVIEGLTMIYQDDNQLKNDGIPGPKTWKAIAATIDLYYEDGDVFED